MHYPTDDEKRSSLIGIPGTDVGGLIMVLKNHGILLGLLCVIITGCTSIIMLILFKKQKRSKTSTKINVNSSTETNTTSAASSFQKTLPNPDVTGGTSSAASGGSSSDTTSGPDDNGSEEPDVDLTIPPAMSDSKNTCNGSQHHIQSCSGDVLNPCSTGVLSSGLVSSSSCMESSYPVIYPHVMDHHPVPNDLVDHNDLSNADATLILMMMAAGGVSSSTSETGATCHITNSQNNYYPQHQGTTSPHNNHNGMSEEMNVLSQIPYYHHPLVSTDVPPNNHNVMIVNHNETLHHHLGVDHHHFNTSTGTTGTLYIPSCHNQQEDPPVILPQQQLAVEQQPDGSYQHHHIFNHQRYL